MDDGTPDFYFKITHQSWLAIVLSECLNCHYCRFIEAIRLDLDGMPDALRIQIGNDT